MPDLLKSAPILARSKKEPTDSKKEPTDSKKEPTDSCTIHKSKRAVNTLQTAIDRKENQVSTDTNTNTSLSIDTNTSLSIDATCRETEIVEVLILTIDENGVLRDEEGRARSLTAWNDITNAFLNNILYCIKSRDIDEVYAELSDCRPFLFVNQGNPDTPEGTRLTPKYNSAKDILEGRLFHPILIDGGQRDLNPDPYWGQTSLKNTGPFSLGYYRPYYSRGR
ncbi:hypothetical protein DY000_02022475 [Brassica cretica]|uniref:Uncharacterized protein n=1 Tax=Brassica cretica TaxID=69181 RepID=A0ABQ7E3U3_BRACR|nr:hypothetical protein DY000_02022475 [Brassica cretica]